MINFVRQRTNRNEHRCDTANFILQSVHCIYDLYPVAMRLRVCIVFVRIYDGEKEGRGEVLEPTLATNNKSNRFLRAKSA